MRRRCALPPNPEATLATEEWQDGRRADVVSWGCNSLVGSARDLALFLAMLANGGRRSTLECCANPTRLLVSENDDGSECRMDTLASA